MEEIMDILVVSDLEQIKALSNSYRISILEAFDNKPATAKMISTRLGESHGKINYHMKMLAKVEILKLVEISTKLGVVEKYYMPVAKTISINSSAILNDQSDANPTLVKYSEALFDRVAKDFKSNISNNKITHSKKMNYSGDLYLTKEEAEAINEKIREILFSIDDQYKQKRENTEKYSVASLIIPVDL